MVSGPSPKPRWQQVLTDTHIKEYTKALRIFAFVVFAILAGLGLSALPFLCGGCGTLESPPHPVLAEPKDASEDWLEPATEIAVRFWAEKGIGFAIDYPGGVYIKVAELTPDRAAEYDSRRHEIRIIPDMATEVSEAGCIIAHELGHCLGMEHVAVGMQPSLMAEVVSLDDNGKCYWSSLDQAELVRIGTNPKGLRCP